MKKSKIILFLLLVCVLISAVSCKNNGGDVVETTAVEDDVAKNGFIVDELTIGGVDISEFVIVKGKNLSTTDSLLVSKLAEKIHDVCGVEIPIKLAKEEQTQYEILIGDTGRDLTSAPIDDGCASAIQRDGKIALYGNGTFTTTYAMQYFINDVLGTITTKGATI